MDSSDSSRIIVPTIPKCRQQLMRWDGWGYKDSQFEYDGKDCYFSGSRYTIGNGARLNRFRDWVIDYFDVDVSKRLAPVEEPRVFPEPFRCMEFLEGLNNLRVEFSEDGMDRLMRCHGQTLEDVDCLKNQRFKRLPDLVVWPRCHDQVVNIVKLALENDVALMPVGGNSAVSGAATTPDVQGRTLAVMDMTQMNRLLWLNKENLTACFEVGIVGQDIERVLRKEGLTVGHEPDSVEFSTLGGWIATRASGMKKNTYGNIEDLVIRVKLVTGIGVLEKQFTAPRVSCGPDFDQMIFGSEGTLGIITEAVVRLRPIPEVSRCGSLVFADFETGVRFLREVARKRLQPTSIRLLDNLQFQIGQYVQPDGPWHSGIVNGVKKQYLTRICGFKLDRIAAVTLVFEGDQKSVESHENLIYNIAARYGAMNAGANNGKKGYVMTFVVAYIRDFGWDFNIMADSFETSVPWDRCLSLCNNVKSCVTTECERRGIRRLMISYRVTQTYDDGCCVYFYMAIKHPDDRIDPVELFKAIEDRARDEILASGGTLSHHHGVGKMRSKWYPASVSQVGVSVLKAVKRALDPKNIFAAGNLVLAEGKAKL
ncbi:alkyldihydroxyacetonephosphate synthase-like [Ochlerotatus camptorhynchus]|uniref:alkyldihydroxyacetonephosphate synthase-like n=1 Tax=Ochlerotatus camptorhynchus TaxID=644619 RepID=UPI0031D42572